MAGPRIRPAGTEFWPEKATSLSPAEIVQAYRDGFCGAYAEPQEKEALKQDIVARGGKVFGADIAHDVGFADSGEGQLIVPFVFALVHFPYCLPGAAQERGDCVSHDQRNANMLTYACELQHGKPDEVTGKLEEAPRVSDAGARQGYFSSEVFYWYRRHGGDGWSCEAASRVSMGEAGLITRDDHTATIGVDLTRYSGENAGKYGRTPPPENIGQHLDDHLIRQATTINSREERRDFLANGYCLSTCGSEGWSDKRDENGFSPRSGSWAHAMCICGFDDRESTKNLYGDSLELVQNSWAAWNKGPRDIRDSKAHAAALAVMTGKTIPQLVQLGIVNADTGNLMVPIGSFWAKSRDVARRTVIAKAGVNGWVKKKLLVLPPFDGVI